MATISRTPNFLVELTALDANAAALFTIPYDRLARRPAAGKWSALQALEHVVLLNRAYFPALREAIDRAHSAGTVSRKPFQHTLFGRFIIWSFEPPPRFRLPVPSRDIVPQSSCDFATVRGAYEENHAELRQLIRDAAEIDMRRAKLRSPFVRQLSVTLGTALGALLAHDRRHLYQARKAAI